ncbi:TetR/AcrR family transcriptional regulator [Jiangella rhizosphaerae]|uniref:TetR/AcrR family transcriptional regulator n=1 Tax=Jiangella rhizosphaerae TaxID=2293569 RepID=A0A418KRF8_9ACTN|nr:TetR/AcrR family transcriptional regulator [Jiangella rhizosphaerae]RIQ24953.1 TetR/AcrR family transcriptional regulator [Jiangella rhizosphaerae]
MPRVSEAHLAARRQQILEAAWRCFSRQGFHATSMQDVFAESGLSAGAVYRYFPSKADLVRTTAEGIAGIAEDAFQELMSEDPVPRPAEALRRTLVQITRHIASGEVDRTKIALHVWSEAVRDEEIRGIVTVVADRIISRWAELAERWSDAGYLAADADPRKVAHTMYGVMIGFVAQRHLLDLETDDYLDGFGAISR